LSLYRRAGRFARDPGARVVPTRGRVRAPQCNERHPTGSGERSARRSAESLRLRCPDKCPRARRTPRGGRLSQTTNVEVTSFGRHGRPLRAV